MPTLYFRVIPPEGQQMSLHRPQQPKDRDRVYLRSNIPKFQLIINSRVHSQSLAFDEIHSICQARSVTLPLTPYS